MSRSTAVPKHRGTRLWRLGRLAGGMAGGMLSEGMRQWSSGKRPSGRELFLTPGNAQRMADQLSQMRGAAMKMGQLLSMEAGEILPKEFVEVLDRLREDAHYMPHRQLIRVLDEAWGEGWERRFAHFPFTPMAAASIGQVHKARLKEGPEVAVKVQYPGVRESIASDVDNVARLIRFFGVFPPDMDLSPLMEEAKQQLYAEADYRQEAEWIRTYAARLGEQDTFVLPQVVEDLTTEHVLTMTYVPGAPIESLLDAPQWLRNEIAAQFIELTFREIFAWGLVQTDPNFANYRYDRETGRIGLLDFGATRAFGEDIQRHLAAFCRAAIDQDGAAMVAAAVAAGYFAPEEAERYHRDFAELALIAAEPLHGGSYDFGQTRINSRIRDRLLEMDFDRRFLKLPTPELMFIQRKLGGLFMLAVRLRAEVDVGAIVQRYLAAY